MNSLIHSILQRLIRFPSRAIQSLHNKNQFKKELRRFNEMPCSKRDMLAPNNELWPIMGERTTTTYFDPHYTYFPAWAARVVKQIAPTKHVDISSYLQFSTLVSAFTPIDFYDYRPANINLSGLQTGHCDLTNLKFPSNSISSLSCMHVVEHIGLGRYGDPIDPDGDLKAMEELQRVLAPGGSLIFIVPIGRPRVQFNAHRIYSYHQIIENFRKLSLKEFSLIPDDYSNGIVINASSELSARQSFGCGCFWFEKN